jgi:glycine oxidase
MVDITVRGAGVFGLSIAWACVLRGARVQVIDPFGPAAGSSGGLVGALAPHVPENWNAKKAFQLESLLMAEGFWTEVVDAGGADPGYRRSGRTQPVADASALDLARARGASAETLWQGRASWSILPQPEDGWTPPSPSGWVIHDTLSAHLHPRQACAALVAALRAKGFEVETEGPERGRVLWATGIAGLEALNGENTRLVGSGIKGQAALFAFDARGKPQLFTDALHVIPHADGTVAIGSTSERDFTSGNTTDAQLDALIEKARHLVPALKDAPVIDRWAGVRPRSRSRAPMLGAWPGRAGHYIANGGFKIGFGMAPRIAQVMADLLLEDRDGIPQGFEVAASF